MEAAVLQFARLYPLDQKDFPLERKPLDFGPLMPRSVKIENPSRDYTAPRESSGACLPACYPMRPVLTATWPCRVHLASVHGPGRADACRRQRRAHTAVRLKPGLPASVATQLQACKAARTAGVLSLVARERSSQMPRPAVLYLYYTCRQRSQGSRTRTTQASARVCLG